MVAPQNCHQTTCGITDRCVPSTHQNTNRLGPACMHIIHIAGQPTPMYWVSSDMVTSSNGNIIRVSGPLCGEITGHRWISLTKASDAELCCYWPGNGSLCSLANLRLNQFWRFFFFQQDIITKRNLGNYNQNTDFFNMWEEICTYNHACLVTNLDHGQCSWLCLFSIACLDKSLACERRRYITNVYSHWLRSR